ncbi:MAG: nuclear transport factor 2 family protein [Acidobacteriota bacterium]
MSVDSSPSPRTVVEAAVAAFTRGDLEAVLGAMADDVDFLPSGPTEHLTWTANRRGPSGVQAYFAELLAQVDYEHFSGDRFLVDGDDVFVVGNAKMLFKATGRRIETGWVGCFTVKGERIVRYRDYWDTASALLALTPTDSNDVY